MSFNLFEQGAPTSAGPLGPRLNLSATRYITISNKDKRVDQHATRVEAEAFAVATNGPDNAVYVLELKGVYSKPYMVTYE